MSSGDAPLGVNCAARRSLAGQDGRVDVTDLLTRLHALPESAVRDRYLDFVEAGADASWQRDAGPEHVTTCDALMKTSCVKKAPGERTGSRASHRQDQTEEHA